MPIASSMKLPKTRSDKEFESICADVLSKIYSCPFTQYGRKGQQQYGIDLVCSSNQSPQIVAQCKNYLSCDHARFISQIVKDIASVANAPIQVHTFVVMTSLDLDTATQNAILSIKAPFTVRVLFWENIEDELCQDSILLKKYYPLLLPNTSLPIDIKNQLIANARTIKEQVSALSCLSIGYNDEITYNKCVDIFLAACELARLRNDWYLQIKSARIDTPIDKIINHMPEFYNATTDWTCGAMVYTITNFLTYFSDATQKDRFISQCDKIIMRTTEA